MIRPSGIASAFSVGFHRIAHRALPFPVRSVNDGVVSSGHRNTCLRMWVRVVIVASCCQEFRSASTVGKRALFLTLLARGWTAAAARREVDISRSTSRNWLSGYKVYQDGVAVEFVPPLDRLTVSPISTPFLSQQERIEIADHHRAGHSARSPRRWDGRRRQSAANCAATGEKTSSTDPSTHTNS